MRVLSLQRLKFTFKYFPKVLKQSAFMFIVLQAINFLFNQIMIYLQEERMSSKEDFFVPLIIFLAAFGFFIQTTVKVIWVLVVCRFFQGKEDLSSYLRHYTEQGLIESLRAFLKSILYGFLLVIPGLVKMIRYQFVVYVVATEKEYQSGDVDALKASEQLARGKTWPLLFLVLFFTVLGLFTTSNQLLIDAPFSVLSMEFFTLCITTLESVYIYLLFMDFKQTKGFSP